MLEEADRGRQSGILIPAFTEDVEPPLGFGSIQAADLVEWDGSETSPGFQTLISSLGDILGPPQTELEQQTDPEKRKANEYAQRKKADRSRNSSAHTKKKPKKKDSTKLSAKGKAEDAEWGATLTASEPKRRRFVLRTGTCHYELECRFRPNYPWNRFVVLVDGVEVAKGGHQYRDEIGLDFPLGDDWVGLVQLGDEDNDGEVLGRCVVSVGGRVLYREPANS